MPPWRPCKPPAPPESACPYVKWQNQPYRPAKIMCYGFHEGMQRFRCKECKAMFFEPAHEGRDRRTFKMHRKAEAVSAVEALDEPELAATVAARLLVDPKTVARWVKIVRERARGRPGWRSVLLSRLEIERGRRVRRTGDLREAPFVVGEIDRAHFVKASYGELRYWLHRERLVPGEELDAWGRIVKDSARPIPERLAVVEEARQVLKRELPELVAAGEKL